MNEDPRSPDHLEPDLEAPSAEDRAWAGLLSSAAKLRPTDHAATDSVLNALRAARAEPQTDAWAEYLSNAATLRPVDHQAAPAVLTALHAERARTKRQHVLRWRGLAAGFSLAAAAVIAGVLVLRAPDATADPNEAYQAYQEASQGW